ncbi:unnamed protein product [Calypogeia fissa]
MMEQLYWASCANGLQFCLCSELEAIDGTHIVSDSIANGGVLFKTTSEPQELAKLRSADNVYAFLGHYKDVPLDKENGLKYLTALASKIDWEGSMVLHRKWQKLYDSGLRPSVDAEQEDASDSQISFRVTGERICLKMKKQGYTSMEAAAAIGGGVHELLGWKADMRSYNVEILAWIRDMELLLVLGLLYSNSGTKNVKENMPWSTGSEHEAVLHDVSLHPEAVPDEATKVIPVKAPRPSRSEAQLHSRRPYRKALVGTSLKPSTAFALLQLGQIAPGHLVVDPMCGCGTIPLEAADWLKGQLMSLAGDDSLQAVDAAKTNSAGRGPGGGGPCDVLQWDAAHLPLRDGTVDRVICDMPFGNRCGNAKVREWLCPKVVKEVVRILQPGTGIAVLMAQSKSMRREVEVTQKPFLELLQQLSINMEGLIVDVYVLQRTMEAPPIQVFYPGKKNRKRSRTVSNSSVGLI